MTTGHIEFPAGKEPGINDIHNCECPNFTYKNKYGDDQKYPFGTTWECTVCGDILVFKHDDVFGLGWYVAGPYYRFIHKRRLRRRK